MVVGTNEGFIGDNNSYIGMWTLEAITQNPAFPEFNPDVWLYRNTAGRVITGLDFQTLTPGQSVSIGLLAQIHCLLSTELGSTLCLRLLSPP